MTRFLLILCIALVTSTAVANTENNPADVSSFSLGIIEENSKGVRSGILGVSLNSGKDREFDTFLVVIPKPGVHNFSVIMSDRNGKVIDTINHGVVTVTKTDHTHGMLSSWSTDINTSRYVWFTIVDVFNGKRYTIGSFKFIIK